MRTVGVKKEDFLVEGKKYVVMDFGGQKNERHKWFRILSVSASSIAFPYLYCIGCSCNFMGSVVE